MRCCGIAVLALILEALSPAWAQAERAYFVVGEPPSYEYLYDSFLLPLDDPEDIAHARDLVRYGPGIGEPLFVAQITRGSDGKNRNFSDPDLPFWSWYVSSFEGFADIIIELYDGSPSGVEADVDWWFENTGGYIGFWSYTVIAELRPGDFDFDLDVDLDDFEAWKFAYGESNQADGNDDGRTSAADFTVWRDHYGAHITLPAPPGGAEAMLVPEPAMGGFALLLGVLMWMQRLFSQRLSFC